MWSYLTENRLITGEIETEHLLPTEHLLLPTMTEREQRRGTDYYPVRYSIRWLVLFVKPQLKRRIRTLHLSVLDAP